MKKRILMGALLTVLGMGMLGKPMKVNAEEAAGIAVDAAHFPDANFREYVSTVIDLNHNGSLSVEERNKVTEIDVGYYSGKMGVYDNFRGICSLKGIQYFPELKYLYCANNYLTELDVTKNTKLVCLQCESNNIRTLNVTKNTQLKTLYMSFNRIAGINLTKNTKLEYFGANQNYISTLDLSKNKELKYLNVGENCLAKLNLSNLSKLEELRCESNYLSSIDIRLCPKLNSIYMQGNNVLVLDARVQGSKLKTVKIDKSLTAVVKSAKNLGWYNISGNKYYVEAYGDGKLNVRLATGWRKIGTASYYFAGNGVMQTGWVRTGGKYYYMNKAGKMLTGRQTVDKAVFYFDAKGAMVTGWKKISGKWYYLNLDGTMAINTKKTINGKTYNFNKTGVCTNR